MLLSLQKEIYKLRHKKKYMVLLIIGIVLLVGKYGIGLLISKLSNGAVSYTSNTAMEILPVLTELFLPILIFMAAADLISVQQQEDTLKADLLRPVIRLNILLSKVCAVIILCAFCMMVFFGASVIFDMIAGGSFRFIIQSFTAYIIDIVPLINMVLFAVLINLCVQTPALAMFLSIALYAVMEYLSYFNTAVSSVLFTSYLRWHKLLLGSPLPFGALAAKLGIIFGTMLIFASVSYIIFDRKSL